jgi:hypothetical protein
VNGAQRSVKRKKNIHLGGLPKWIGGAFCLAGLLAFLSLPHASASDPAKAEGRSGPPDAALARIENGFCRTWDRYPDCAVFEIRQYERFFSQSSMLSPRIQAHVLAEMARRYQFLAEKFREPEPWLNPGRADLCGAMAQELGQAIIRTFPGTPEAQQAQASLARIPAALRPAVPMPREVSEALSREGD